MRTLDPERALGSALVVAGDKIAAVLDDPLDAHVFGGSISPGACVLPGFVDAHVHFPSWALGPPGLRLFDCTVARRGGRAEFRRRREALRPGGWLRGRGWRDEPLWSGEARLGRRWMRSRRACAWRCGPTTGTRCG